MSLQVWLPLNGNLNNYGLSDVTVTNNGATVDSNGKIGSCYSFNTEKYLTVTRPVAIAKEISYSCWVRLSSWNESFDCIMSMETGTEWKNNRATLCRDGSSTHLTWNIANGSSNSRISSNTSLSLNTWYHIACTYNGAKLRIYVNGVEDNSADTSLVPNYDSANLYIGASSKNTQHLNGCLNDVRIYDHCLSAKEVKEISKGLICHYKLSNSYETGQRNKYSGTVASGAMVKTDLATKTALENERGYNYKFTRTGDGKDYWFSMDAGYYSFTAGKRYYYSCKVRCHSANFSMHLRASRSDNDWVTNKITVIDSPLADGKWHEYVVSQVVNSTYDRVGTTMTCNPILEFYTENLSTSGKVYSADFDIKDVQVIESDCYVPFIDNSMSTTEVSDCSGLGNNGTAVGNITYKNSSARYEGCYDFDGDTGCIQIPNLSTLVPGGEFTMNCWIYHDDTWSSKEYETIFGGPNNNFELEAKKKSTNSPVLCAWSWGQGTAAYELNKWNMITMTRNTSETKFYINGELKITGSAGTIPSGNYFIGAWKTSSQQNYKGKISDFRLYSNVLSEEDIKTLYSISASVDKSGNMYAYEFREE